MTDADSGRNELTTNPLCKRSGITEWPEDERPRERLLSRGAHTLTDAEVLAILLRVGVQGKFTVRLRGLADEHFRVAYLNRQGRLLEDALLAEGTVDTVRPTIRSIVARALQTNASALIAAYNHPSGAGEPSEADKILTRDLIAACHPIGIKVLEHVIVAEAGHFSFADTGLLDELSLDTLAPTPVKG